MVEKIYQKYLKELTGWCTSMTCDRAKAEDLVQEAFLRALDHQELFRNMTEQQCRAWMYRTVKNLYYDRLRHERFEITEEELPERTAEPSEYEELEQKELLAMLPEEERLLFAMRYMEGYNSRELGEIFSMPPATVRMKLASARKKLQKEWKG